LNKCRDVMIKDPLFCLPSDRVAKVAEIMQQRPPGPVLIIDSESGRKLAGIVTFHDVALKVVAVGRDPNTTQVGDVMTPEVVTIHADDDLKQALTLMTEFKLGQLPVVDSKNRIVGILTHREVLARLMQPTQQRALAKYEMPDSGLFKKTGEYY